VVGVYFDFPFLRIAYCRILCRHHQDLVLRAPKGYVCVKGEVVGSRLVVGHGLVRSIKNIR